MPKESQNHLKALWKHLYKADISFFLLYGTHRNHGIYKNHIGIFKNLPIKNRF